MDLGERTAEHARVCSEFAKAKEEFATLKADLEDTVRELELRGSQLGEVQARLATLEADHLELGQLHTKTVVELYQAQTRIAELEADLKEQLCQAQERLAVAEEWLQHIRPDLNPEDGFTRWVDDFLAHAPTDYVVILAEDLAWALNWTPLRTSDGEFDEHGKRLATILQVYRDRQIAACKEAV
jgi:hypothetical protein